MSLAHPIRVRRRIGLEIGLVLMMRLLPASCVKKFAIALPSSSDRDYGLKGIFRDDFPFYVSSKTPDPSAAIPPTRHGCSVKSILQAGSLPHNEKIR